MGDSRSEKNTKSKIIINLNFKKILFFYQGMVDPGEKITKTLAREFAEEALSHNLNYDENDKIQVNAGYIEQKLNAFFKSGTTVAKI